MLGRLPSTLNHAFLLGLTKNEVKFPDSFVKTLENPILVSDEFNECLEDCKNGPIDVVIRPNRDAITCNPTN